MRTRCSYSEKLRAGHLRGPSPKETQLPGSHFASSSQRSGLKASGGFKTESLWCAAHMLNAMGVFAGIICPPTCNGTSEIRGTVTFVGVL